MKITLYQTADMSITPGKIWLAHMDLGSSLFMSFFGATEEAALERATAWYEGERKKYDRKEGNGPVVGAETISDNHSALWINKAAPKVEEGWSDKWTNTVRETGKVILDTIPAIYNEHKLTGSVWVLNRATGHRARIAADQLASYEEKGYVKGGPRSK